MKQRYILHFPLESVSKPLTTTIIRDYGIDINILRASISPERGGELLMEFDAGEEAISKGLTFLEENNVEVERFEHTVKFREEECIHCGACTAVCFTDALSISGGRKLLFDHARCVACGLCIAACPLRLFTISWNGSC